MMAPGVTEVGEELACLYLWLLSEVGVGDE